MIILIGGQVDACKFALNRAIRMHAELESACVSALTVIERQNENAGKYCIKFSLTADERHALNQALQAAKTCIVAQMGRNASIVYDNAIQQINMSVE